MIRLRRFDYAPARAATIPCMRYAERQRWRAARARLMLARRAR